MLHLLYSYFSNRGQSARFVEWIARIPVLRQSLARVTVRR